MFSVMLHVLVIAGSMNSAPVVMPYQPQALLKLALTENNTQQIQASIKPEKINKKTRQSAPIKTPVNSKTANKPVARQKTQNPPLPAKPEHEAKAAEIESTATTPPPATTMTRATVPDRQQLTARIQKHLRVQIAYNYWYPNIAVRNAWEGQVNLGLRVQANGKLTNIHVINSSGYSILDKAAVNSVRHVAVLPEASDWLQGQTIDVILPVIYKLTDS